MTMRSMLIGGILGGEIGGSSSSSVSVSGTMELLGELGGVTYFGNEKYTKFSFLFILQIGIFFEEYFSNSLLVPLCI